ncbi:MAG TPA: NAD-dependent epimerase/dehydratase family protein [Vicinamibacterales bacterium]|nr:NAD-dependent epimerase/dehydratase family protein [Vicinamibacterales bacterium]
MRALVTGATGFTGGHLARSLAAAGDAVTAFVRTGRPDTAALTAGEMTLVHGDLRDPASIARATAGIDVVYHIAALYRQAGLADEAYRDVNARAAGAVVEAAARNGVRRVVHCSTVGVHGDIEHPPANEDAPLRPGDIYQRTKVEGEQAAREAAVRTGIELTIVRPTGIYGPGDRRLLRLFRGVARRRWVTLGAGDIFYHLTYIDDLVAGFRLCGTHPAAANRTYILAGGEVTTLNELVRLTAVEAGVPPPRMHLPVWPIWIAGAACEAICRPFGIEPPIYRRRVDFFTKSRAFDIARARNELGYAPQVGLREGIRRTLAWYREHGWL